MQTQSNFSALPPKWYTLAKSAVEAEQEARREASDCVSSADLAGPEDSIGHGSVVCVKVERVEDESSRHN